MAESAFQTGEEVEEIGTRLFDAFKSVLMISALGSISVGDTFKGAVFSELLARMHYYKMEQARILGLAHRPASKAKFDATIEDLWPHIKEELDKDLAAAAQLMRERRGEEVH